MEKEEKQLVYTLPPTIANVPHIVQGYTSVAIWNCNTDQANIGIWSWDGSTNGPWQKRGDIPQQYVANLCGPGYTNMGLNISLTSGHIYRLLATNLNVGDDPNDLACIRASVDVMGGSTLGTAFWTIP